VKPESTLAEPISAMLKRFAEGFDQQFSKFLETVKDVPESLGEAMRYSALAPGKRLRPYLVTECCRLVGGPPEAALPAAAAIECVHAFSLIHDDLPAMDNADLRRGRPTSHVKFGEGMAVLAGDGLLALAFELLTVPAVGVACPIAEDSRRAVALVRELSQATGWRGMVGGQVADLEGETQPVELGRVEHIHRCKTAKLLEAACRMGAISGGGDSAQTESVGLYGLRLGMAFQIADDLLDVTASVQQTGKTVGRDADAGKQTYPACVGMEQSWLAAGRAVDQAVAALETFEGNAQALYALAKFLVERAG